MFHRNGTFLLYNSLSNSFVELSEEDYNCISECISRCDVNGIDDDLKEDLREIKTIVKNDDFEISKGIQTLCAVSQILILL